MTKTRNGRPDCYGLALQVRELTTPKGDTP
jgi:hypothetical protein